MGLQGKTKFWLLCVPGKRSNCRAANRVGGDWCGLLLVLFELLFVGCWKASISGARQGTFGKGFHFCWAGWPATAPQKIQRDLVVSDWWPGFFSNTLGLPHWGSKAPCWECDAQNCVPCTFGKGYKEIYLEKQRFKVTSHVASLANPPSTHALFTLPGVSAKHVRGDPLHILFCRGLYGHLIGSILHYCCWIEGPGHRTKKKPGERLVVIFNQIQIQYSQQECKNRLTNLKISMFTEVGKPWASWANLGTKAGESKHLLPALVPVMQNLFETSAEPCEQHMLLAATGLEKLVSLWIWKKLAAGWHLPQQLLLFEQLVFGKGSKKLSYCPQTSQLCTPPLGVQAFKP